jgi:glycosyltransferase involved in cell wall biosynthesis
MEEKIRVAWLGSGFIGRPASGTAQTARKAICYLSGLRKEDIEVTILVKSKDEYEIAKKDKDLVNCRIELLDQRKRKFLSSSRQYYRYCWNNRKTKNFDVLHFSVPRVYPYFYYFPAKKFIATFHAGGDVTVPRDKFVLSRWIYNWIIRLQWPRFDRIIADSNFGVMEISTAYSIPVDKISKVYLGADNFWDITYDGSAKKTHEITVVGRWQKYKNVHTAIRAIAELNSNAMIPFDVQLIGKSSQLGHDLVKEALSTFKVGKINVVDYLSDKQLAELYRESTVVIHPSINEGFGLPAFEAFGEGAILIVHTGTPASEILSNFEGVIVENLSTIEGIKLAIGKAFKDFEIDTTKRRDYLKEIGATWSDLALNYLNIYRSIL